ncbi:PfkB family carbohydrate kinase [Gallaecimonas xiamenensis]|uniref:PfkB domain-containing protein n=1 Tax=Gallaecimonas xiamenensis 3-C-1 TaxID=745411 RepID=K2KIX0_9GAMM|nr:PfkB family carbohydrate kinase [Gallaecimonas xiamenensis]EKE77190.1 PfkB domain-containing protein [Gallaecimonas xiamenensis 3-C-1]
MTERERQILELLKQDPLIPQQQLADQLGLSRSAVAGHIMNLTQKGHILGKGYVLAPSRYALVLGGANLDLCGKSQGALHFGDSNPGTLSASAGGVARNIADNLARLGSPVQFVSALGDDDWGERLLAACRQSGMGLDGLLRVPGARTCVYLSVHDNSGEMQLALSDMEVLKRLDAKALQDRSGLVDRAAIWVLDANLDEEALAWLFARHAGQPVLVDPVSTAKAPKLKPYLGQIQCLKPNALEAGVLTGIRVTDRASAQAAAQALVAQGVGEVLLTLGADGALLANQQGCHWLASRVSQLVNVTGAGDAALAAMAHGLLQHQDLAQRTDFALWAAALAASHQDTIHPLMSEAAVWRLKETTHATVS